VPCTTAGLRISKGAPDGAAGTIFYNIDFTNPSGTARVLEGYPGVSPAATCSPVTAHWLTVFPPNQRAAAYVSFATQTCASTAQPTMTIAAINGGP